ncbi:hypothetical protein M8C21_010298 [Ambrosia artemisiifolia]|uniref:Glycoside hydrolase 35 catalytic domain-containing protein n=1 Tax=Ambrosia artemisiifolia TaxID=4212 RepID=A0AAD5GF57_AMBAR|nr:hypothetical protein M8C21_010298 [Ambrosia artemisiifolia]
MPWELDFDHQWPKKHPHLALYIIFEMLDDCLVKAEHGGLDVIDTYVFWNVQEPSHGTRDGGRGYAVIPSAATQSPEKQSPHHGNKVSIAFL